MTNCEVTQGQHKGSCWLQQLGALLRSFRKCSARIHSEQHSVDHTPPHMTNPVCPSSHVHTSHCPLRSSRTIREYKTQLSWSVTSLTLVSERGSKETPILTSSEMASGVMQEYVDMVQYAVSSENGQALADALSLQGDDPSLSAAAVSLATRVSDPAAHLCPRGGNYRTSPIQGRSPFRALPKDYASMVQSHYKAASAVHSLQWQAAFKLQLGLLK